MSTIKKNLQYIQGFCFLIKKQKLLLRKHLRHLDIMMQKVLFWFVILQILEKFALRLYLHLTILRITI